MASIVGLRKIFSSMALVAILSLFSLPSSNAQVLATAEYEVVGRPSWEMTIPTKNNGLILLAKTDVTKAEAVLFDKDLKQVWKTQFFIDAERPPVAYTVADDKLSFLFSETNGMYYQLIKVGMEKGTLDYHGYELREFFVDQDYVLLNNKILMAGKNDKGGAFYSNVLEGYDGQLKNGVIAGDEVNVNHFEYMPTLGRIESLWSVKENGYTDPAKKKGAFVKSTKMVYAEFDTTGNLIKTIEVNPKAGNFPLAGQLVRWPNGTKAVVGTFQTNTGDKGVFFANLANPSAAKFYSYRDVLQGGAALTAQDFQALMKAYEVLPLRAVASSEGVQFGGVFFKPEYRTVTTNMNNQNSPYGNRNYDAYGNRVYNNQRTQSQQVFNGFSYPLGYMVSFDANGDLMKQERIDLNHVSPQVQQTLAVNASGIVAYCLNGTVAVRNSSISSKPMIYRLTTETTKPGTSQNFVASYNEVAHWTGNTFIAKGSKYKIEAQSIQNEELPKPKKGLFGKSKAVTPKSETLVRKTIYLTKIAGGQSTNAETD